MRKSGLRRCEHRPTMLAVVHHPTAPLKLFSQPVISFLWRRARMWARSDLVAELKGLGLLRTGDLERSFLRVRQESFLPESFGLLAYADMPLPRSEERRVGKECRSRPPPSP